MTLRELLARLRDLPEDFLDAEVSVHNHHRCETATVGYDYGIPWVDLGELGDERSEEAVRYWHPPGGLPDMEAINERITSRYTPALIEAICRESALWRSLGPNKDVVR